MIPEQIISIYSSYLYPYLIPLWQIIKNWWWLSLPFLLRKQLMFIYLWWRVDGFLAKQKQVLLKIKLPQEINKPIRAMESVLSSIHAAINQPPNIWEKWVDGQVQLSISLEIASIDGETNFYIRTPNSFRDAVEASLYAQYPEIELIEVEDYTKQVPQNIPNKEWDLFGCSYRMIKPDYLPIKTYSQFETEREVDQERIIDPLAGLLEGMSRIKKGEQFWFQFLIEPVTDSNQLEFMGKVTTPGAYSLWAKEGIKLRDKIAHRPTNEKKKKSIFREIFEILFLEPKPEKKEERELIPPEMKLTPGEREVLEAVEKKMAKPIFNTAIRFIFMGRQDVWLKAKLRLAFVYFNNYSTNNLNAIYPNGKTITKIKKNLFFPLIDAKFIYERRKYLRARQLFKNYVRRVTPFYPLSGGTFMMNTEEVASLFHFPGKDVAPAPGFIRIKTKRSGVPPTLPIE